MLWRRRSVADDGRKTRVRASTATCTAMQRPSLPQPVWPATTTRPSATPVSPILSAPSSAPVFGTPMPVSMRSVSPSAGPVASSSATRRRMCGKRLDSCRGISVLPPTTDAMPRRGSSSSATAASVLLTALPPLSNGTRGSAPTAWGSANGMELCGLLRPHRLSRLWLTGSTTIVSDRWNRPK